MGFLGIGGNGRHEPNFKVEFEGGREGLGYIVLQTISQQNAPFVLGEKTGLPGPVESVRAYLSPGGGQVQEPDAPFMKAVLAKNAPQQYILEAEITPLPGQKLDVAGSDFSSAFETMKHATPHGSIVYVLKSSLLPKHKWIEVRKKWPSNRKGVSIRYTGQYRREQQNMQLIGNTIKAFASALETTVNSVYHSAGKPSPKETMALRPNHILKG